MKYIVKNFTLADEIEISSGEHENQPLISVICRAGSMYFQHSMTPEQAREMAEYLIAAALKSELLCEEVIQ